VHPEIDRYAHLDSSIHRWDPRWKLASLSVLLLAMALASPPAGRAPSWDREVPHALASLAASLALVQLSRIPLAFALGRSLPAALFLGAFMAVYSFLGSPAGGGWPFRLALSPERFQAAAVIALRALAMLLLCFPMFGTSRFDVTMKALRSLRVPAPFVQLAVFTYRYIYVYTEELGRMRTSMRARGFRGRPSLYALRTMGNAVGMLLVRSVERTQRIQEAMTARGYSGTFRTFDDFSARPKDLAEAAVAVAAAAGLAYLRFKR